MVPLLAEPPARADAPASSSVPPGPDAPPSEPLVRPDAGSAEDIHFYLLRVFRIGNRVRREFLETLLHLDQARLYLRLGYSSTHQYAEAVFGLKRSQTFESLRVARRLPELPLLSRAFDRGELSWCALREISRVATAATEERWLEFARSRSVRALELEVREAVRKGRDAPRKDGHGLPRLEERLVFDLTPEEHDLVSKALRKAAAEIGNRVDGSPSSAIEALVFIAERVLATDPDGDADGPVGGRREKEESIYTVLYHQCPDCRRASLPGPDGAVEIPAGVVERVAGDAERVQIRAEEECPCEHAAERRAGGRPEPHRRNTAGLTRRVFLRDGGVCSNPRCRRRLGLHAHHVEVFCERGASALWNETLVCSWCHALIHRGLLSVRGDPVRGLVWTPRAAGLRGGTPLERDLELLARLGVGEESRPRRLAPGESTRVDSESTRVDSGPGAEEARRVRELAIGGLVRLGCKRRAAEELAERAERSLLEAGARSIAVDDLVRRALQARSGGRSP